MKKILSMLLVCALMLASVFCLAACGEEPAPGGEGGDTTPTTTTTPTTAAPASPFPAALTNVEALEISGLNLEYVGFALAGGMIDGVEMEEADVQSVLDACGGQFNFFFMGAGECTLVNGADGIPGTYTVVADGYFIDAHFEGYDYYGAFTMVEGNLVLILVNKTDSEKAFYMSYIDEH